MRPLTVILMNDSLIGSTLTLALLIRIVIFQPEMHKRRQSLPTGSAGRNAQKNCQISEVNTYNLIAARGLRHQVIL